MWLQILHKLFEILFPVIAFVLFVARLHQMQTMWTSCAATVVETAAAPADDLMHKFTIEAICSLHVPFLHDLCEVQSSLASVERTNQKPNQINFLFKHPEWKWMEREKKVFFSACDLEIFPSISFLPHCTCVYSEMRTRWRKCENFNQQIKHRLVFFCGSLTLNLFYEEEKKIQSFSFKPRQFLFSRRIAEVVLE